MPIADFLAPADVFVDVRAATKGQLLKDLADRASASADLDPAEISREILARESLGSTGIGKGIALPHARLSHVTKPFGLFARLKRPIDFDAIDAHPVDLVFLLLLPLSSAQDNPNALASVARKLRDSVCLDCLRQADDASTLFRELVG